MPELPDVEGFRRYFARFAQGKRIEAVRVQTAAIVRNSSPQGLGRALKGRRFEQPERTGKWLFAPADGPILLMHFGMTGGLNWYGKDREAHRHDRALFRFADGTLAYRNMRMLGGLWLARGRGDADRITGALGPDAADLDREDLDELLSGRRGGVKATLMNQRVLSGIGNELSDEVLWQARLAPRRPVQDLGRHKLGNLHRAMREVLIESMRRGRIPRHPDWLTSQRRAREPTCPRCRSRLRRETVAGRTAYWCPRCQR